MEQQRKNLRKYIIPAVMLIVGVTIGWLISSSSDQQINKSTHQEITTSSTWTCSMHPSVRQSEPGSCPICGMDLIPLANDDDGGDPMEVRMSETAMKLANIQTTIVGSGSISKEIRLNGKVQADERLITSQTSHLPGRIEKLKINFTGDFVRKGQVIAEVYSPELVTAQQELLEAAKMKDVQPELFSAAKAKLSNWKLREAQIQQIINAGEPITNFPLHADYSGIVLDKKISSGDHVMQGQAIYEIVDLSRVWVLFDVYESDLQWVKTGSEVSFTIQSLPGEVFTKKISFIDPLIDPQTRVASARVEMPNADLRLKPEMFASATLKNNAKKGKEIVIPKTAVMWTGERSVVYIKNVTDAGVSFRMTQVTLGPSLGDSYVIKEGLTSGQEIVTNGTFTIDAAAQLEGKPSMMSPEGGAVMTGHDHEGSRPNPSTEDHSNHEMGSFGEVDDKFKNQISDLLSPYLALKDALVQTDAGAATDAAAKVKIALSKVDMKLVNGEAHNTWMKMLAVLNSSVNAMSTAKDIEAQRKSFSDFSDNYYAAIQQFDVGGLDAYYQYCPMAFNNKGAYWISQNSQIQNPYFGDKMMKCGVTKTELK